MSMLNIALLQILPTGSLQQNLEKGIAACKKAKEMGADIALFPEIYSTGYHIPQDKAQVLSAAIGKDHLFVQSFSTLARELDMAIGITFLEYHDPLPCNSLVLFDRFGKEALHYKKVHTCDFGYECMLSHGDGFAVCDLDTAVGPVKVGAMICYDREFPESGRILMLKGAEVVLVPNACPMEINRLSQLRGRAYENMMGIATCNYPAPHPDCNGHSSAYDGVAYWDTCPGSRDMQILLAPETEGVYMAAFDLEMMRTYRQREVHGNCYRRPEQYAILTEDSKSFPFIRSDFRP